MTYYVANLDVSGLLAAPTECPACGGCGLDAVSDGEFGNFWCPSCGACWHLELSSTRRVDPTTCTACARRESCLGSRVRMR